MPSPENTSSSTGLINPSFPGGLTALAEFVEKSQRKSLAGKAFEGGATVFVEFVVNTDGAVSDFVVLKGGGANIDQEAVRIISEMPRWTAGTLNGEPVRVKLVLPVSFPAA
ncbi:hypothetical protein GCM10028807_04140 [Spirosoma daeguense]